MCGFATAPCVYHAAATAPPAVVACRRHCHHTTTTHTHTQVSDTMMSVATLTGDPLSKMTSKDSAPKIVATVVGKGGDFSNLPGQLEGIPAMPQVRVLIKQQCMHLHVYMSELVDGVKVLA